MITVACVQYISYGISHFYFFSSLILHYFFFFFTNSLSHVFLFLLILQACSSALSLSSSFYFSFHSNVIASLSLDFLSHFFLFFIFSFFLYLAYSYIHLGAHSIFLSYYLKCVLWKYLIFVESVGASFKKRPMSCL